MSYYFMFNCVAVDVEELRIGNIIEYDDLYYSVRGMQQMYNDSPYDLTLRDDHDLMFQDVEIEECKPIPLTEDWLLRMGANKPDNDKTYHYVFGGIELFIVTTQDVGNSGKCMFYAMGAPWYSVECKYVHQLQNLYYALTGKELNIEDFASSLDNVLINEQNKD